MGSGRPAWEELLGGVEWVSVAGRDPELIARQWAEAPPVAGGVRAAIDRGADPAAELAKLLERAGFGEALREAAAWGWPVTVAVNDAHRLTDTRAALGALFAVAEKVGSSGPFRLLVAAGSHRAGASERRAHEQSILAGYRARFCEIRWHECEDASWLAEVGPAAVHRWLAEPGLRIGVGSLEPHYFAGITGAHKTISVGAMSRAAIEENHAAAMKPEARPLVLAGNPVHEGIARAVEAIERAGGRTLALNEVIVQGALVAATAGRPLAAVEEGAPLVRRLFGYRLAAPVDLLVARVAPPLDRDFYQADKGIKNTEAAVRDGGVLLLEAECRSGVGIDHFLELLAEARSYEQALARVAERGYRLGDHKAVRLRHLTDRRRVHVGLVTRGIDPELGHTLGICVFSDPEEAAAWARELTGERPRALMVEDAGNTVVEVAG